MSNASNSAPSGEPGALATSDARSKYAEDPEVGSCGAAPTIGADVLGGEGDDEQHRGRRRKASPGLSPGAAIKVAAALLEWTHDRRPLAPPDAVRGDDRHTTSNNDERAQRISNQEVRRRGGSDRPDAARSTA